METFWKAAVGFVGVGAIVSFVLWSLYREWIRLDIWQRLTKKQQFWLFVLFLSFTFVFAIAGLISFTVIQLRQTADVRALELRLAELEEARESLQGEVSRWRSEAIYLVLSAAGSTSDASEIAVSSEDSKALELASNLQRLIDEFERDYPDADLNPSQRKELERAKHSIKQARVVMQSRSVDELKNGYGFEDGLELGWEAREGGDSQACVEAEATDDYANVGSYSLRAKMDLDGRDKTKDKGEVFLRWTNGSTMLGEHASLALADRTVSAWVFAPPGAYGDAKEDVGLQLFVKNADHNQYLYGSWTKVYSEGRWMQLKLHVGRSAPEFGRISAKFDPNAIAEVGVKLGLDSESEKRVQASVYIDDICW